MNFWIFLNILTDISNLTVLFKILIRWKLATFLQPINNPRVNLIFRYVPLSFNFN